MREEHLSLCCGPADSERIFWLGQHDEHRGTACRLQVIGVGDKSDATQDAWFRFSEVAGFPGENSSCEVCWIAKSGRGGPVA
jgi:hypothetical protein